jgi:S1-C subfamily serine protease
MPCKIRSGLASILIASFFCYSSPFHAQANKQRIVKPTERDSLRKRYESLVCAIVLITTEKGTGTGFFVDREGDMVTAAHVVSSKDYVQNEGKLGFTVNLFGNIRITPHDKEMIAIAPAALEVGKDFDFDLAVIRTGQKPPCWIPLGKPEDAMTGDHLLSIGFPGIDNGNPILYEGFLSGRFKHPPIPVGQVNGQPIYPTYDVLKVQMPITAGASGSPVIDDSDHAIAVISESPMVWTHDLENIARVTNSGVVISGFDTNAILGQLASIVHEFESPGSGWAVPVSYLQPRPELGNSATSGAH